MTGSSPLARGLLLDAFGIDAADRIIPARAGFTSRAMPFGSVSVGSSPLARGLRGALGGVGAYLGIIPARAGFTLADPWNPNDEPHYQTAFAFTADLALAPQSSDSAVVSQRSTRPPSEA